MSEWKSIKGRNMSKGKNVKGKKNKKKKIPVIWSL